MEGAENARFLDSLQVERVEDESSTNKNTCTEFRKKFVHMVKPLFEMSDSYQGRLCVQNY